MAQENGDAPNAQEKKIIQQIEYYFGDMNLPRDKFLQEKTKQDDGWVALDVLLTFNRLKKLSEDKKFICKALLKSTSGLIEVHEDFEKIRRNPAVTLPDNTKERKEEINARSVYVKGFPLDMTLDALMEFFQEHGKMDSIQMRRNRPKKDFKGSVFVVFSNKEEEDKFLATEGLKYQETELIKLTKEQYFKRKSEQEKDKKKSSAAESEMKKAEQKKQEEEKRVEEQMTKGAVLFMKGLPKETTVDDIKKFFGNYGEVAWVEFAHGDEKGLVRFHEGVAEAAMEKAKAAGEDGKVMMGESELELRVVEGEEEKEYWLKMFRDIADRRVRQRNQNFKGGQNRKRKFGSRNKGSRDNGDGGDSAAKKKKTSEGQAAE